jgi:hypothetical protein
MSQTFEFYHARAEESASEAQAAQLDNVRDRALRSEATWRGLAEQARKVAEDRVKAEHERSLKRAAEAEALARLDADALEDQTAHCAGRCRPGRPGAPPFRFHPADLPRRSAVPVRRAGALRRARTPAAQRYRAVNQLSFRYYPGHSRSAKLRDDLR